MVRPASPDTQQAVIVGTAARGTVPERHSVAPPRGSEPCEGVTGAIPILCIRTFLGSGIASDAATPAHETCRAPTARVPRWRGADRAPPQRPARCRRHGFACTGSRHPSHGEPPRSQAQSAFSAPSPRRDQQPPYAEHGRRKFDALNGGASSPQFDRVRQRCDDLFAAQQRR